MASSTCGLNRTGCRDGYPPHHGIGRTPERVMTTLNQIHWTGPPPTVLLVHGAFTDASSWAGVIPALQAAGLDTFAPANPLRGLAADTAYLASVVAAADASVLLVGHAYGGAVITATGAQAANVVGLVYVAAFAPAAGESMLDIATRFPQTRLPLALRPIAYPHDGAVGVELYVKGDEFPEVFAADLPARVTRVLSVAQRPIVAAAFEETARVAAWEALPAWYAVATADQVIHPEAQRFMARRAGAHTVEVVASHAIALSQPAAVADLIRTAAAAIGPLHEEGGRYVD
jgi:pimeloyl-ACP methyl ester carboxylesterase